MKNKKISDMTLSAVVCALYVALCFALNSISFGPLQFRLATMLLPFGLLNKKMAVGLLLGVIISNITSSLGIIDVLCGTSIQILQFFVFGRFIKNIYVNSIVYALLSGTIVGLELQYVLGVPFTYSLITVGTSGLILFLLGIPLCQKIMKEVGD